MSEQYRVELKAAGLARGGSDKDRLALLLRPACSKRMLPLLPCDGEKQAPTECARHVTDVFGIIAEEMEINKDYKLASQL